MYYRKLDELGRIILPVALRREAGIGEGCSLALSAQNGTILLTPAKYRCDACGQISEKMQSFHVLHPCTSCMQKLKSL